MKKRVLVIDDDPALCDLLEEVLSGDGYCVTTKSSAEEALSLLSAGDFDAVITDLNMKGMGGIGLCERLRESRPELPVIVITAFGSLETAVAAIRSGAYDFITKPFEVEELALTLDRAVQLRSLRKEVKQLRIAAGQSTDTAELIGESSAMVDLRNSIALVAGADSNVLITGETGTGKELVARALHRSGPRATGPFVAVNCSAFPEGLLESEFFGHSRGAFTDAGAARTGLFVRASGGTLFLDEVGEMPPSLQSKILRAIEERLVRPLGEGREVAFDARIIAATNRDLETAVEEKCFREDLYFRINVVHLQVPPLRSRGGDVLLLAQHFLRTFAARTGKAVKGITVPAAEKLLAYPWPGNVRELQNCIERALVFTSHEDLLVLDFPPRVRDFQRSQVIVTSDDPGELVTLEEVERRYILRVLEAVEGNKAGAARILGLGRKTLYRKLERYSSSGL